MRSVQNKVWVQLQCLPLIYRVGVQKAGSVVGGVDRRVGLRVWGVAWIAFDTETESFVRLALKEVGEL